jgi:predicted class III extradiol MEMO1 family dioxygenase
MMLASTEGFLFENVREFRLFPIIISLKGKDYIKKAARAMADYEVY